MTPADQGGGTVGVRSTDARGTYAFTNVAFATYRLAVQAQGHPAQDRSLVFARDRQVHDVVLSEQ